LLMTWTTPFDAIMSAATTSAPSKLTLPPLTTAASSCPESDGTGPVVTSTLGILPPMTWLVRMQVSVGISPSNPSTVPSGSAANASSFGAEENK
jgi:hypothetical protein